MVTRRSTGSLERIADNLKTLTELAATKNLHDLSPVTVRRIRRSLVDAYAKLQRVIDDLDPVKQPSFVFDPSNPRIVGRVIGIALVAQPRRELSEPSRFYGSGVYALYYKGAFSGYRQISGKEHPIYVGKADPEDPTGKSATAQGERLSGRLNEHRKNITKASSSLKVQDFEYRALVVQSGWQTSAEEYLIDLFRPIWNNQVGICYGFGKHGDSPHTRANLRSPWDTLHPGRDWAHRDPNMLDARPRKRILSDIKKHLMEYPPFASSDQILRRFLNEMGGAS